VKEKEKEVMYSPKYEELFAPEIGPENPFQTRQQRAHKNMLTGFVKQTHFQFENQPRSFNSYGKALGPTVLGTPEEATHFIGATEAAKEADGKTVLFNSFCRPYVLIFRTISLHGTFRIIGFVGCVHRAEF
jgi:pre-mRNA-processing factor 17